MLCESNDHIGPMGSGMTGAFVWPALDGLVHEAVRCELDEDAVLSAGWGDNSDCEDSYDHVGPMGSGMTGAYVWAGSGRTCA